MLIISGYTLEISFDKKQTTIPIIEGIMISFSKVETFLSPILSNISTKISAMCHLSNEPSYYYEVQLSEYVAINMKI
jgi:hypothetical protein